jgi:flagellar biosynthesis protein FlhA
MAGHHLAMDPGDALGQLPGIPTTEPAFGLPAVWVADSGRAEAEALGWTVVDGESVVVTHLTETIRSQAAELLSRQETRNLLDQLKETNAAVVDEVVPDILSLGEVQRVLQALLREGVSIRDLGAILEAIGDKARLTRDPAMLAEYARQALGRTIVTPYLDGEGTLRVIALDPALEQEVAEALVQTADGEFLAMDPARAGALVEACAGQVDAALAGGARPVLLCSARVRRHLRRLVEQRLAQLAVCSYNEVPSGASVETLAVLGSAPAAAMAEPVGAIS